MQLQEGMNMLVRYLNEATTFKLSKKKNVHKKENIKESKVSRKRNRDIKLSLDFCRRARLSVFLNLIVF